MERMVPDRIQALAAILAHHFEKAEEDEKAAHYYAAAAATAARTYANAEALRFYERALEHIDRLFRGAPHQPDRWHGSAAEFFEQLGTVQQQIGRHEEARDAYAKAGEHVPPDDRVRQARLHRLAGASWQAERQTDRALQAYETAEQTLALDPAEERPEIWREWIQLQLERIWSAYWLAQVPEMQRLAAVTRPAIERWGTPGQRARYFFGLINIGYRRTRYAMDDETLANCHEYLAASKEAGDLHELTHAHFCVGFAQLWRGDLAVAAEYLNAALELARKTGNNEFLTLALTYLTVLHRKSADIDQVNRYLSDALTAATASRMVPYIAMARANRAWLALRQHDVAAAEDDAAAALDLWKQAAAVYPFQWAALWPLIRIGIEKGDPAGAIEHTKALMAKTQQQVPAEIGQLADSAVRAWEQDQRENAIERLETMVDRAIGMGYA